RESIPPDARPARYGGEEFAVLLPGRDIEAATELADSIRSAAQRMWTEDRQVEGLTLSAGCVERGARTAEPEGLVLAVELAVAQAKQLGRNRVCRFDLVAGGD